MKRDPELIKKILEAYEAIEIPGADSWLDIQGYTDEAIYYHNQLLADEKLVEGKFSRTHDQSYTIIPYRLTNKGHDLLDIARKDSLWEKAKPFIEKGIIELADIAKTVALGKLLQ